MRRSTLLFLASVTLFVTFLGLEPLLTFPVWGSDSGEYYVLTSYLLDHGQFLRTGYAGNGFGYPYFPGMFEVGAAVAGATGADPLASLLVTVPVLGALSILPLFLLFRRFYPHDGVAILGAALAGAVFPRLFSLSHAAPLTMGDLFVVASLWMFVEQRKDPRWLLPLGLTLFALIATHHFSSYIFFITATGGLALFELYAPGRWAKRFPAREFGVLGAFVVSLFTYWFLYAPPFADRILPQGVEGRVPSIALPVAAVGVLALLALGVYWSRRSRGTTGSFRIPRLRWPSLGKLIRDPLIVGLLVYGGLATLLVVPIPGTHQTATPLELVYYSPFVLLGPLSAANRRFASFSPLGYIPWFILATVGASAAFGLVTALSALVALGGLPAGSDEGEDPSPPSDRSRGSLFHSRPLLFLGLSLVGLWAASYALVEYLVPYAVSFRGFSPAGAGTIDGLGFGASLAGSSLGGVLADRSPRLLATFVTVCVAAAISVLFIPFTPGAAISVWVLAFGAFQGMGFSLLYLLPLKFRWVSPRTYSLGLGLFETLQVLLGSLLVLAGGVFFFGPGHPDAGWVYLALVTVLSLGTLLGLRSSRGSPRDPAPQGGAGTDSGGTGSSVR